MAITGFPRGGTIALDPESFFVFFSPAMADMHRQHPKAI
jgi:hypothetical protein